jgi:CO/xanthine dehydrogenase Mo-binding subunit
VPRIDAREKVTGAALYTDDLAFGSRLLYARIKRSPHPHAMIRRIDVTHALALPGVKAVVTGDDTPGYIGLYLQDRHIFCRDRVRYVGDPVAGVAAVSELIAEQALDLIDVDYEILPPVLDPEDGARGAAASPPPRRVHRRQFHLPGPRHEHLQPFQDPQGGCRLGLVGVLGDRRAQVPHSPCAARPDRAAHRRRPGRRERQGYAVGLIAVALRPA